MGKPAGYRRRQDAADAPFPMRLGIVLTELQWAIEDNDQEAVSTLRAEADQLKTTIERLKPKEAKQDPSLPLGFRDMYA